MVRGFFFAVIPKRIAGTTRINLAGGTLARGAFSGGGWYDDAIRHSRAPRANVVNSSRSSPDDTGYVMRWAPMFSPKPPKIVTHPFFQLRGRVGYGAFRFGTVWSHLRPCPPVRGSISTFLVSFFFFGKFSEKGATKVGTVWPEARMQPCAIPNYVLWVCPFFRRFSQNGTPQRITQALPSGMDADEQKNCVCPVDIWPSG